MKRTSAAAGLLVLGLILGSALGALAGRNLAREAEAIDQTFTSFAPSTLEPRRPLPPSEQRRSEIAWTWET